MTHRSQYIGSLSRTSAVGQSAGWTSTVRHMTDRVQATTENVFVSLRLSALSLSAWVQRVHEHLLYVLTPRAYCAAEHAVFPSDVHNHCQYSFCWSPRLAKESIIVNNWLCLPVCPSVCLSVCHKTSNCFFFVYRWNRAIFWPSVLREPLYKTFSIFDLGPLTEDGYLQLVGLCYV